MTYRVYIKKDYKPEVKWVGETSSHLYLFRIVCYISIVISGCFILGMNTPDYQESKTVVQTKPETAPRNSAITINSQITDLAVEKINHQDTDFLTTSVHETDPMTDITENEVLQNDVS